MIKLNFTFNVPSQIIFQNGSSNSIVEILKEYHAQSILCVYDKGIKDAGIAEKVITPLEKSGINVSTYSDVTPDPKIENVLEGYEIATENNIDLIVAIGGGSSMDCAKAINILLTNGGSIRDYEGRNKVNNPTKPLIAVPTTAGTGSEVTSFTIISDTEKQKKMVIGGKNCGCDIALVDPELTLSLPASVTAATGTDALTHAIEAYVSKNANIPSQINAIKAIELITQNLEKAVNNGSDIEARSNMMLGSLLAGIAFNSAGLGMVHAIAHALGAKFKIAHGIANAIALPYVVEYNSGLEEVRVKCVEIAKAMNIHVEGKSSEQVSQELVQKIMDISSEIRIPTLKEVGIGEDDLVDIAESALKENSMKFTPRSATKDEMLTVLNSIYFGAIKAVKL